MAKTRNYRELKKALNKYHAFSFRMPRKGQDFTPQQKAAITRQYEKLKTFINQNKKDKNSFIPYQKGAMNDLLRLDLFHTNKGVFFPRPGAELKKRRGKYVIEMFYKKRHDLFIPLPKSIYENPALAPDWLHAMYDRYYPAQFSISIKGYQGSFKWTPFEGMKYFMAAFDHFSDGGKTKNAINGIFITEYSTREEFIDMYEGVEPGTEYDDELISEQFAAEVLETELPKPRKKKRKKK